MRTGTVQLDGSLALVRAFPHWFAWSPAAETVRTALADGRSRAKDLLVSPARANLTKRS
jgi:hypothetical protein